MFYSHTGGCRLHGPRPHATTGMLSWESGRRGDPEKTVLPTWRWRLSPSQGHGLSRRGGGADCHVTAHRSHGLPHVASASPAGDPLSQPRGLWRGQGRLRRGCCGPATAAALISYQHLFLSSNTCCSPPVAALQMGTLWDPSAYTLRLPGFPEGLPRVTMPGGT